MRRDRGVSLRKALVGPEVAAPHPGGHDEHDATRGRQLRSLCGEIARHEHERGTEVRASTLNGLARHATGDNLVAEHDGSDRLHDVARQPLGKNGRQNSAELCAGDLLVNRRFHRVRGNTQRLQAQRQTPATQGSTNRKDPVAGACSLERVVRRLW